MHICNRCTRSFIRKSDLHRHINNRQTPCQAATYHCSICNKGLANYQTLWKHKKSCHMEKLDANVAPSYKHFDDDSAKDVPMDALNSIIDTSTDHPTAMQVVPHLLPSKNSIPPIHDQMEMSLASQKKVDSQSRVGDSSVPVILAYSDEEDGNEDGGDVELLLSSLDILGKYIGAGYTRLGPAIIHTADELHRLDVITEEQYQQVMEVFQLLV